MDEDEKRLRKDIALLNRTLKLCVPPRKMCYDCGKTFLLTEENFYPIAYRRKNGKVYYGWDAYCRKCSSARCNARMKRRRKEDPEYSKLLNKRTAKYAYRYRAKQPPYSRAWRRREKRKRFTRKLEEVI